MLSRRPDEPGEPRPLGTREEVADVLARYNTAPDGSPPRPTGTILSFGPGFIVELPATSDTVSQAMVSVNDIDYAWPVLARLCKEQRWTMTDLESGQSFGA